MFHQFVLFLPQLTVTYEEPVNQKDPYDIILVIQNQQYTVGIPVYPLVFEPIVNVTSYV